MRSDSGTSDRERLKPGAFVLGGLSFIPLIGIPLGLVAIVWGLLTRKLGGKKLALLGLGGIFCSVFLYGALFYFGFAQRGGIYDMLRAQLAQSTLSSLVPAIEVYRIQHGAYPVSLEELRKSLPNDTFTFVFDPTDVRFGEPRTFYYERVGTDHYYLRAVGPDGKAFTDDDILPKIDPSNADKLGLLLKRQK